MRSRSEAARSYAFMRETSLLLESSGFGVLVPNVSGKLGARAYSKPAASGPKISVSATTDWTGQKRIISLGFLLIQKEKTALLMRTKSMRFFEIIR